MMIAAIDSSVVDQLRAIVGADGVLSAHSETLVYECDGFVIEKNSPDVVVFPALDGPGAADRPAVPASTTCRFCRAGRAPAWPAAACRSAAA